MVPISKNRNKKKHQTVNFINIMRLSFIYLITAQPLLNDTTRHDSIIQTIMNNLVATVPDTCRLYSDINGYEC